MNNFLRYFLIILGVALLGFLLWYFSSIVAYILIAGVFALIGRPVVDILSKARIWKFKMPRPLSALITLLLLWVVVIGFFRIFIPLIANQANELSNIDTDLVIEKLEGPIQRIEKVYYDYGIGQDSNLSFEDFLNDKVGSILGISIVSDFFSYIFSLLGNIFIAIFSISFILFFFLKDQSMFADSLVLLVPQKHEEAVRKALSSTRKLLMRYFIGIGGQIIAIIITISIGMTIVGIEFQTALIIGLIIGLINVIPYVGPWIGGAIGIVLGLATHIHLDFTTELLPMVGYMLLVVLIVQVMDNIFFQPLIFSSSVKAHPLEIFLVILIAGTLAGITGMILAIPTYTVIRVFAKEFLNKFRVVQKLTRNI
ncbi:MAG: AI-2E family transporter [Bacteroidales bacterium]|nr:AI-2E family transporter [Bacteroidales bacterium]